MLLENKIAVICGVGGAVARAFAAGYFPRPRVPSSPFSSPSKKLAHWRRQSSGNASSQLSLRRAAGLR